MLAMLALPCLAAAKVLPAAAAAWPTRPIKFVIGLAAGGGTDVTARLVASALADKLGQSIVIENLTGAGGTLASAYVARATSDNYSTFEVKTISAAVINSLVYSKLSYNPITDFKAVSLVGRAPLVAVTPASMPAQNLREFLAVLKANPGKYSYGSAGMGTIPQIAGEQFKHLAGVDMVEIPYRGNGPAMAALLAGDVALIFDTVGSTKPYIDSGKIRSLGVTTAQPTEFMPDALPIGAEVPGFAIVTWFGIYAPAKTPDEIVNKMSTSIAEVLAQPAIADKVKQLGYEPVGSTPQEFDRYWHEQLELYSPIVKRLNIKLT
jgi:tripartite-type tricarboxylate transporter receptor subunit TctC